VIVLWDNLKVKKRSVMWMSAIQAVNFHFLMYFVIGVCFLLFAMDKGNDDPFAFFITSVVFILLSIVIFGMSFSYHLKCYSFDPSVSLEKVKNDVVDASFNFDGGLVYLDFILPERNRNLVCHIYVPISKSEVLVYKFDHKQKYTKELRNFECIKQNLITTPPKPEKTNWVKKWQSDPHLPMSYNFT
jgi:hypothetical protein